MEKNKHTNSLECIYALIAELGCEKPDLKVLKNLCVDAGIEYETDLVQLMSKVLVHASCFSTSTQKTKKTSKILIGEA